MKSLSSFLPFLGALLIFPTGTWAQVNRVQNFSFENADPKNPALATNWSVPWGWSNYERAPFITNPWDQTHGLRLGTGPMPETLLGAIQIVPFNQTVPNPIRITVRVRGENISDVPTDKYGASLYGRVRYQNGAVDYFPATPKTRNVGTFWWRYIGINTGTMPNGNQLVSQVEVLPVKNSSGEAWFDDVHVAEYPLGSFGGAVTIFPDDGFKEQVTLLLPEMTSRGMLGTIALVSQYLQNGDPYDPRYMNRTDALTMHNAGWEIASHGIDHTDLASLTNKQIENQLFASKKFFTDTGIPVKNLALPFGGYNALTFGVNNEYGYYRSIRGSERGYNPMGSFPYGLKMQELKTSTTLAEVEGWLTEAKNRKAWLIIMLHKIQSPCPDAFCISPTLLRQVLDAVKSSALPVVTYDQGLTLVKALP